MLAGWQLQNLIALNYVYIFTHKVDERGKEKDACMEMRAFKIARLNFTFIFNPRGTA
jgi:hypothetical protein